MVWFYKIKDKNVILLTNRRVSPFSTTSAYENQELEK